MKANSISIVALVIIYAAIYLVLISPMLLG